ncbi:Protein of unknown function [Halopseudomonas xinjiangensis]|uniref:DUF2892 domain-containing protein n=1 Tax=Halopseudomonas xinjiangensis TaxID=487184 RepID=A0A1H1UFN7_9GAMM|nr:YgaP-like transmembrane domain [Halopseudomonas xinjiangensis]SDS71344.1 Protein of unknown function [Halopseudomonas xinjiangensis]
MNQVQSSQGGNPLDKIKSVVNGPNNVQGMERAASLAGGALLVFRGMRRGGIFGLASMAMGAAALMRGSTGHCEMKQKLQQRKA